MSPMKYQRTAIALSVLAFPTTAGLSLPAAAQGEQALEEVVIVGSRRQDGRSQADSLVPVDVLTGDDLQSQGTTDMDNLLSALIPSYIVDQQAINDAATLVRPARLRGLPPDSTLVLVNGKRRHRAAVITFLGNGVADGSHGPDVSTIPAIALKRVEVLRDGAAAQYGSDAIAGVINFELKDDAEGGAMEARWGEYYEGDGAGYNISGNIGFPLGANGFLNLSGELKGSDPTNRSVQRSDAQTHIDAAASYEGNRRYLAGDFITATGEFAGDYPSVFHPNVMVWGAPEFKSDYKFFANYGFEVADGWEVYGHANYAEREVEGGFYYRNPHTRSGVFAAGVVDTATGDSLSLPSFKMANGQVVLDEMGVPVVEMDKEMMPMMETFSTIGAIGLAGAAEGDSADVARIKNAIKTARETQLMTAGANNTAIQSDNLRDTVRIADLHYHNTGMAGDGCGVIRIENNGVANPDDIQRVADDANCESFISRFPGGFVPRFGGVMNDRSFALGLRGELGGWFTDLSGVWGRHEADFFMHHTLNPQLLATDRYTVETIPTSYDPGAYTEIDYTINLDFARAFDVAAFTGPMNVAFGFEYRQEEFEVSVGGENSWYQDVCPGKGHAERCDYRDHLPEGVDPEKATDDQMKMAQAAADARAAQSLSAQGFGVGSNGFTGFGPRLGGKWSRESYATYADVEAEINSIFTAGIAVRYEDHDDAGDTADFKLSGRAQINDIVAVRSAVSTGFRAPTVGQANILNVTTAFTSGMLQDEATLPPTHPASALVGGEALTPEESTGFSLGTVLALGPVDVTADYYYIEVTDRIARSSDKTLTDEDRMTLEAQGVPDAVSFSQVRFYTNDFDTVTQGLDVVATMPVDMLDGVTDLSLAANWTDTSVEERNPDVIDDKRVKQLEENQPNYRWTFTANHANGPWNFLARVRYYGSYFEFTTDDASAPLDADDNFLVDLEASYTFGSSDIVVVLGAENVFDEYPSEVLGGNVAGLRYSDTSPYGFNGGYYYLRTLWNF